MEELGWDRGQDDEELFEFAMHEKQYREYKSGEAKKNFNRELQQKMEAKFKSAGVEVKMPDLRATKYPNAERVESTSKGRLIWELDYNDHSIPPAHGTSFAEGDVVAYLETPNGIEEIKTNFAGKIVSVEKQQGDLVEKGDVVAYLEK
jgi:pyruvate carboxylase subunit B